MFEGNVKNDAIAAHTSVCGCEARFDETQVVAVEPVWFRRKVREALEIRRLQTGPNDTNGINKDNGDYVTTSTWKPLFNQINSDSRAKIKTFESMTF